MNQPVKVPEPSMEEILASIRRIIADDDAAAPAAATEKAESESGTATAEDIDSMFGRAQVEKWRRLVFGRCV